MYGCNLYLYAITLLTTGKAGASMYDPLLPFVALGSGRLSAAFYVEGLLVST